LDRFKFDNIRSDDTATQRATLAFLLENPREGVRLRPEEQLGLAFRSGLPVAVRRAGRICACSFIYEFTTIDCADTFSEIGTMLVTENGYGLQWFMACLQIFQVHLENSADNNHVVFAVVGPNTDSEHVLRDNTGLKNWTPTVALASLRATAGTPFVDQKLVLVADDQTVEKAISSLRGWHLSDRIFQTPKKGGEIELQMGWFHPDMLKLSLT
jgi:hypothetical protein